MWELIRVLHSQQWIPESPICIEYLDVRAPFY